MNGSTGFQRRREKKNRHDHRRDDQIFQRSLTDTVDLYAEEDAAIERNMQNDREGYWEDHR